MRTARGRRSLTRAVPILQAPRISRWPATIHRFEEDVALLAELGLKAYRFSIAWTRIVPDGDGGVNPAGVAFYHRLLDALLAAGITPIATMYHFDLPAALDARGGWTSRATVDAFAKFAEVILHRVRRQGEVLADHQRTEHDGAPRRGASAPSSRECQSGGLPGEPPHDAGPGESQPAVPLLGASRQDRPGTRTSRSATPKPATQRMCSQPTTSTPSATGSTSTWRVDGRYNSVAWAYLGAMGATPEIGDGDLDLLAANRPDFIAFNYYATHTVARPRSGRQSTRSRPPTSRSVPARPNVYSGATNPYLPEDAVRLGDRSDRFPQHLPAPSGTDTTCRSLVTENGLGAYDQLEDGQGP